MKNVGQPARAPIWHPRAGGVDTFVRYNDAICAFHVFLKHADLKQTKKQTNERRNKRKNKQTNKETKKQKTNKQTKTKTEIVNATTMVM